MNSKVALVTGASSGIGEATALKLLAQGYTVYAAARRVERMRSQADAGVHVLAMDVTEDAVIWDPLCAPIVAVWRRRGAAGNSDRRSRLSAAIARVPSSSGLIRALWTTSDRQPRNQPVVGSDLNGRRPVT